MLFIVYTYCLSIDALVALCSLSVNMLSVRAYCLIQMKLISFEYEFDVDAIKQ